MHREKDMKVKIILISSFMSSGNALLIEKVNASNVKRERNPASGNVVQIMKSEFVKPIRLFHV